MTRLSFLHHIALCLALALLSATVVRVMIWVRVLDLPDSRKSHNAPTPKSGGVGIVAGFMVGIAGLYEFASFSRLANGYFIGLIVASAAIAVVALLDDLFDFSFKIKLLAQIAAAGAALGTGLYIATFHLPYLGSLTIGRLGIIPSLFWILFVTNAFNFIDGLDGLAGGVALIACAFLAWIGASQGGWFVYFAALLLASGLAGFLPFNFPKARIFMGDVGSQFCGFVLAMLGIAAGRFDAVPMSFALVPLLLFGILFDVAFTLARRATAGDPLTSAHRGHLYQLAHRSGMPGRLVTLIHWGFAAFGGLCCLAFIRVAAPYKPLILLIPFLPQTVWLIIVVTRAKRHEIGPW